MRNSSRRPSPTEVDDAHMLLARYRATANPIALTAIGICILGPVLLAGSDFLAAFPELAPALELVMVVAWLNGCTVLVARDRAKQALAKLSSAAQREP
jgi:hypothetical protein